MKIPLIVVFLWLSSSYTISSDNSYLILEIFSFVNTDRTEVYSKSDWTVIQRRIDDSLSFNKYWEDYKMGFGTLKRNYFIGLEQLHLMTKDKRHLLYIELRDINGTTAWARYNNFAVGNESEGYKLKSVGDYKGTAGDSLSIHVNMKFSTIDRDNDVWDYDCAHLYRGGWWFKDCGHSALNGIYHASGGEKDFTGILWGSWKGKWNWNTSLTYSKMMIRPKL